MKIEKYEFPDGIYYHKDHSWARVEGAVVKVGVDDFFLQESGNIVYIDMPVEYDKVNQGEEYGSIKSPKGNYKLISPVNGEVVRVNEELENNPSLLNKSPYENAWIAEIKVVNFEKDKENLMKESADIEVFIKTEIKKIDEGKGPVSEVSG